MKLQTASRNRLAGAGCKPPQAAWVKAPVVSVAEKVPEGIR
jgi:hypothetical protein